MLADTLVAILRDPCMPTDCHHYVYFVLMLLAFLLRFLVEHDPEVGQGSLAGKEKMRDVYENALAAGGLHLSLGSRLWNLAR